MTPLSGENTYCTAAQLVMWVDWRVVADYAADPLDPDDERPTRAEVLDEGTDVGAVVLAHLVAASGELETACVAGKRYTPDDLRAVLDADPPINGATYIQRLVANLAVWSLMQRRHPETADPEKSPGAKGALAVLEMLRKGERILPFEEAAEAGGGPTTAPLSNPLTEPAGGVTTTRAGRLFDTRPLN